MNPGWGTKILHSVRLSLKKKKKQLKIYIPYDSTIPLLGIYPEKTMVQNDSPPAFTAALFTVAKTRKQPKCPSTEERIKKMWEINNGILLSL